EALPPAKARAAVSSAPKAPEPVVRLVPDAAPRPRPDLLIEHHSEERTSTTLDARGTPKDLETFDGTMDLNAVGRDKARADGIEVQEEVERLEDRKSTRLNSSHEWISYAVFCLKKKNNTNKTQDTRELK